MKKILLPILILNFLYVSGQDVLKKPVAILSIGHGAWSSELYKSIKEDTLYLFSFRNASYSELVDMKTIVFTRPQLKIFGVSLEKLKDIGLDEQIPVLEIILSKLRMGALGNIKYEIFYEKGISYLSEKDIDKFTKFIKNE